MEENSNEKRALVDVYIAPLPLGEVEYPIFPTERELEIRGISSDRLAREKYHAWRLLEYALNKSFGLSVTDVAPRRQRSGKWVSDKVRFSISHEGGAVAVALSRYPVGLDIERRDRALDPGFARRMLTASEQAELCEGRSEIIDVWCRKEALFKMRGGSRFIPRVTETVGEPISSFTIELNGVLYAVAVAAGDGASVRLVPCEDFN